MLIFGISMFFGILSLITGLILYFWPRPRAGFYEFLGMNKGSWGELHTYFSILALIAISVHIVVNRRSVKFYWECLKKM